jgi:hypothetical protein
MTALARTMTDLAAGKPGRALGYVAAAHDAGRTLGISAISNPSG